MKVDREVSTCQPMTKSRCISKYIIYKSVNDNYVNNTMQQLDFITYFFKPICE